MPEVVYRRSPAFLADTSRRMRIIGFVVIPSLCVLVTVLHHFADPDWLWTLVSLPLLLVVAGLSLLLTLWLDTRWDLRGRHLEVVTGEGSVTLRGRRSLETISYQDIRAVRGRTSPTGEIEIVEIFRQRRQITRLHGFDGMRELFEGLSAAAGGRALVEPRGVERHLSGTSGIALGVGIVVVVLAWRLFGPGWSLATEIVYQLLPALCGVWFVVKRPLSQWGVVGMRTFENVMGPALVLCSAGIIWNLTQLRPVSPEVVVDGRVLRSTPLGFELALPESWTVTDPRLGSAVMLHERTSDAMLALMAFPLDDTTLTLDQFLGRSIAKWPMHQVSDIVDDTVGPLRGRSVRIESDDKGPRVGKMKIGRKGTLAMALSCLVPITDEPDFTPCDRLLNEATWR